jgi:RecB family exonuclease
MLQETSQRERSGVGQLSYSGASELKSCSYKYYLHKIARVAVDADSDPDTYSLRFGSAVHEIMENTLYNCKLFKREMIVKAVEHHQLEPQDVLKCYACCMALYDESEASGLKVIRCELLVKSEHVFGYIDAIGVDETGRWWIMDLKTSSWVQELLPIRLSRDPQLNLYAAHRELVAEMLGLDVADFGGCIYRVTTKPRSNPHHDEKADEYYKRTKVKATSIIIPAVDLDPDMIMKEHLALVEEERKLREGEACPKRNFSACIEWNRPCEYMSHCYKKTYTEILKSVQVSDNKNRLNVADVGDVTKGEDDMLNVTCLGTQVFNESRIVCTIRVQLGAAEITRPYYFDCDKVLDAAAINAGVDNAILRAKSDLYAHLAALAESSIYQSWAAKLGVAAVPAAAKMKEVEVIPTPAVIKTAPVVEAKAVEAVVEAAPAPAAKKAKVVAKADDLTFYVKGDKECSAYLKAELARIWPSNWTALPEHKAKASALANELVEQKIPVTRNGAVAQEFVDFVSGFCSNEDADI